MPLDPTTLERIVPDLLDSWGATGKETLDLHVARYRFAARHLSPGTVLDIACGVGYGSKLLVEENSEIAGATGVDMCEEAIAYARLRYQDDRIGFVVGDALRWENGDVYDNIVTLETIEHLPNPETFFTRLVDMLRPRGRLVASAPTTPSVDGNPHHQHDFTERTLRGLGRSHGLREVAELQQSQPYHLLSVLGRTEQRMAACRRNLPLFYLKRPGRLLARLYATVRYGFCNRYLTVVWEKPA